MRSRNTTTVLTMVLAATFWMPGALNAQTAGQPGSGTQGSPASATPQGQAPAGTTQPKPPASGTTVNPSQAPLQPVTTYPDASGKAQSQSPAGAPEAPQPKQQGNEPQGPATAEKVPTAGSSAAKPAGVAIAPAKQHRTRSMLIKLGAVAAAGVAAGTIYALSHGTSSTPPGTNTPGAVPK